MHRRSSITLAIALTCLLWLAVPTRAVGQALPGDPGGVEVGSEEGWSLDDIKDVFEAVHFFAITIGIGVGTWWFATRYLSAGVSLTVELDVGSHSSTDEGGVVELVAWIRNDGINRARIARCTLLIAIINAAEAARRPGALREGPALKPLTEVELISGSTSIGPHACLRLTTVVALPPAQKTWLLSVSAESAGRSQGWVCERLLCPDDSSA